MLRWAFWALLLANLAYFAGSQGYLGGFGWTPADPGEPQRLTGQIEPERLRLLNGPRGSEPPTAIRAPAAPVANPQAPSPTPTAAPAPQPAPGPAAALPSGDEGPRACWQAGGFTEPQAELLRAELRLLGMPDSEWQFAEVRSAGRWIVYMGRFDSAELASRKKGELRALDIEFRDVGTPGLTPGLALGTFSSEDAARQALQQTERRGVRTARVVQERAESSSYTVRLPAITDTRRSAIDALGMAMAGKTLQRCG